MKLLDEKACKCEAFLFAPILMLFRPQSLYGDHVYIFEHRCQAVIIELMNIYISHPSGYDYKNEIYKPIKESELARVHRFFLPHEPENIDVNAKDELRHTDVLVAEASLPSTGQGIELGQANAAGVPIICFYKTGAKLSGSLRFVTDKIIEYSDINDLFAKLQAEINQLSIHRD